MSKPDEIEEPRGSFEESVWE